MKFLKRIILCIDKTNEWIAKIASWAIVAIIAVTVYEVVMRYFLNAPTKWAFEFNYLTYGPYFLLIGAYAYQTGQHVNVDIIYSRFSQRNRAIIDICTFPFFFFFIFLMFFYGGKFALNSWAFRETLSSAWAPPIYPIKMVIPIAALMLLLQGTSKLVHDIYIVFTGKGLSI